MKLSKYLPEKRSSHWHLIVMPMKKGRIYICNAKDKPEMEKIKWKFNSQLLLACTGYFAEKGRHKIDDALQIKPNYITLKYAIILSYKQLKYTNTNRSSPTEIAKIYNASPLFLANQGSKSNYRQFQDTNIDQTKSASHHKLMKIPEPLNFSPNIMR